MAYRPPEKLVVFGIDGPILPTLQRLMREGRMPLMEKLVSRGTWADNCLVPYPTITPPNWTTIATGASAGRTGFTDFNVHWKGEPLGTTHAAFDSRWHTAEYLWEAAEKVGKRSIVINWPSSWPARTKEGWQIAGYGLTVNEWHDHPTFHHSYSFSGDALFSTDDHVEGTLIDVEEAEDWQGVAADAEHLEAELTWRFRYPKYTMAPLTWHVLLEPDESGAYTTAHVCERRDKGSAMCSLRAGEWSDYIVRGIACEELGGPEAVFRIKLLELSPDGETVSLFVTPLCQLDGWTHPDGLDREIFEQGKCRGLPAPYLGLRTFRMGWFDADTFIELCDMHHQWFADAARYLMERKPWDLFFIHIHTPDYFYHLFASEVDPALNRDAESLTYWQEVEARMYQSLDQAFADMAAAAPRRTLYAYVSDHGAKANGYKCNPGQILIDAGLTVLKEEDDPDAVAHFAAYTGRKQVDWSKTRAAASGSSYIWVNLKGRDPDGSVVPADYVQVQNEVIKALYDYTDPETGLKPIGFAFKKQDARFLDLYGDTTGDIVFCYADEYGSQHGPQFPSATDGMGDMRGLFALSGPGIRKGHVLERNVNLKDLVPTVCYLMDLPVPADCEGAVVYQALDDADAPLKERMRLQRHVDVLSGVAESEASMTHTYHKAEG